ncbi:MAG: hypothetical protein DMG31_08585 [Acidobacteria bacterium]|nr:MAG: hypothetical protein DMG31_08585 [Acidobacteriota bacterium]
MVVKMLKLAAISVSILMAASSAVARADRPQHARVTKDQKTASAPALAPVPIHDISGTWEPANGPSDGIQANGVKAMPNDGKPEHQLPYTPLGLQTFKSHKALEGVDAVLPGFYNDPRDKCEPIGFPRTDFYNLSGGQPVAENVLQSDPAGKGSSLCPKV